MPSAIIMDINNSDLAILCYIFFAFDKVNQYRNNIT